jgi:hypothetical protein
MIVFSGWGSIVGLVGAGGLLWLTQAITGSPRFAGVLAGAALAAFGWWIHAQPGREFIDVQSGATVMQRTRHTLFWIPIQYWGLLVMVGGIFGAYA